MYLFQFIIRCSNMLESSLYPSCPGLMTISSTRVPLCQTFSAAESRCPSSSHVTARTSSPQAYTRFTRPKPISSSPSVCHPNSAECSCLKVSLGAWIRIQSHCLTFSTQSGHAWWPKIHKLIPCTTRRPQAQTGKQKPWFSQLSRTAARHFALSNTLALQQSGLRSMETQSRAAISPNQWHFHSWGNTLEKGLLGNKEHYEYTRDAFCTGYMNKMLIVVFF